MLLRLFVDNLLPVLLMAAAGYVLSRWKRIDPHTLSNTVFYVLSPCLIFTLLTGSPLDGGEIIRMMSLAAVGLSLLAALAWAGGWFLRLPRRILAAVSMMVMLPNAASMGLSVNLFAFGEEAVTHASLYYVMTAILLYTLGVVIASLGKASLRESVRALLAVPAVYAAAAGFLFQTMSWRLPLPLARPVTLLGNAAIPVMLVLLGVQFQRADWRFPRRALGLAVGLRLVVSPAMTLLLGSLLGLPPLALRAGTLESAMPIAIATTILATQYDVEPSFVTSAVFISTLLSPLSLTPLLAILGA